MDSVFTLTITEKYGLKIVTLDFLFFYPTSPCVPHFIQTDLEELGCKFEGVLSVQWLLRRDAALHGCHVEQHAHALIGQRTDCYKKSSGMLLVIYFSIIYSFIKNLPKKLPQSYCLLQSWMYSKYVLLFIFFLCDRIKVIIPTYSKSSLFYDY